MGVALVVALVVALIVALVVAVCSGLCLSGVCMPQPCHMRPAGVLQHASNCCCWDTLPGVQDLKSVSRLLQSSMYVHALTALKACSAAVHGDSRSPSSAWCCNDCSCWCCVQVVYQHMINTRCQAACNCCYKRETGCVITSISVPTENQVKIQYACVVCE